MLKYPGRLINSFVDRIRDAVPDVDPLSSDARARLQRNLDRMQAAEARMEKNVIEGKPLWK
jgi:hypothetical protein